MILSYAGITLLGLVHFIKKFPLDLTIFTFLGLLIFFLARYIRNASIHAMGNQWYNHTSSSTIKRINNLGPYEYCRHPYYFSTFIEICCYALIFSSVWAIILAIGLFLPLVFWRIGIEEESLRRHLGKKYQNYCNKTNLIFNFLRFIHDSSYLKDMLQLIAVAKKFGFKRVSEISFLGKSISGYSRGYAVSRILGSLIEVGVIDEIKSNKSIDIVRFAKNRNYDEQTLKTVCDYLAEVGIFTKTRRIYGLTKHGERICSVSRGAFTLLYAYMPAFEALPELIRKKQAYGLDVKRLGIFVGKGSNELAQLLPFPFAKDMLGRHSLAKILDIGCGAGEFLLHFCKKTEFSGCGMDIDYDSIALASSSAKEMGLGENVSFIQGDLLALNDLKTKEAYDVITLMFVIHEFLKDGEEPVIKILKGIKSKFPTSYLFIAEVYKMPVSLLIKKKTTVAEHHLFHRLSNQGLATLKRWRSIFEESGYEMVEERRLDKAAQTYFLLKPIR